MSTININVSKTDMGLDQVDNTSDLNKPISTATQTALDNKVDKVTGSRLITSSEATVLSNTSGVNTGDQDLSGKVDKVAGSRLITSAEATVLGNTSGTNTGDETVTTIKTKLGITTLSGSNTGDQDLSGLAPLASPTFTGTITLPSDTSIGTVSATELGYLDGVTQGIQAQINAKVNLNTLITPSTGTKVTYDAKGLILSSTNITTSDVSGLGTLATQSGTFSGTSSGTNTGDQTYFDARVQTVTSSATVTPVSTNDLVKITAQSTGLTLANPTGTFSEGQALMIRIKDNGTARTIAFDTNYRAIGVTLPTTTVISKTMYLGVIYNSTDSKFDVIGYNIQA